MKKPFYKRWWFVFLIIALIGGIVSTLGGDKETVNQDLTLDEQITDIIYKIVGKEEEKEDTIINLTTTGGNVRVVMRKNPVSEKKYKSELLIRSKQLLEKIAEIEEIEFVSMEWQGLFVDQHGDSEYNPVMRIDMKRETLEEINWKDFDKDNIEDIADDYWQHKNLD